MKDEGTFLDWKWPKIYSNYIQHVNSELDSLGIKDITRTIKQNLNGIQRIDGKNASM